MEKMTLLLEAATRVPAYRDFLARHGATTQTRWEDLPLTNKKNYLLAYPTESLCWDGSLIGCHLIGTSSGFSKSGSVFWPKRPEDEGRYIEAVEQALIRQYAIDRKRTLVFVCLAFGTWIGGMQIASAMRTLASFKRHPLTVATPGLNLAESVELYRRFGYGFDQVIWMTNPSNVNILLALMERSDEPIRPGSIYFPVVGEYFPEGFRRNVARRLGHPIDEPFCVWTGYGSADAGDLGMETEATIRLRKFFHDRPNLSTMVFGTSNTPMLLQPSSNALIEIVEGNIVVSKNQMVPLLRYDTGDAGELLSREDIGSIAGISPSLLDELPERVLCVRGRTTDAVVFYGTNLPVSDINEALLSLPPDFGYGGLFQIREEKDRDFLVFAFHIFVTRMPDAALQERYSKELLRFLKQQSLEFAAKYDLLSQSAGESLIRVELEKLDSGQAACKHRFIMEE